MNKLYFFSLLYLCCIINIYAQETDGKLHDYLKLISIDKIPFTENYNIDNLNYNVALNDKSLMYGSFENNKYSFYEYQFSSKSTRKYKFDIKSLLLLESKDNFEFIYNISFDKDLICIGIYKGALILKRNKNKLELYDIVSLNQDFESTYIKNGSIYFVNFFRQTKGENYSNNIIFTYDIKNKAIYNQIEIPEFNLEFAYFKPNKFDAFSKKQLFISLPSKKEVLILNKNLTLESRIKYEEKNHWLDYNIKEYFDSISSMRNEYIPAKEVIYTMREKFSDASWIHHIFSINEKTILINWVSSDPDLKNQKKDYFKYYTDIWINKKGKWFFYKEKIKDVKFKNDEIINYSNFPLNIASSNRKWFCNGDNKLYMIKAEGEVPIDWSGKTLSELNQLIEKSILDKGFILNLYTFEYQNK